MDQTPKLSKIECNFLEVSWEYPNTSFNLIM